MQFGCSGFDHQIHQNVTWAIDLFSISHRCLPLFVTADFWECFSFFTVSFFAKFVWGGLENGVEGL